MPAADSIDVGLRYVDARIDVRRIEARRTMLAPLLRGRAADDAVDVIGHLYAVCIHAQRAAARAAVAAARGHAVAPHTDAEARGEAVGELCLAALAGESTAIAHETGRLVAAARRISRDRAAFASLVETRLLGGSAARWLAIDTPAELTTWARSCTAPLARACAARIIAREPAPAGVAPLPLADAPATLDDRPMLDEAFARTPTFRGEAAEAGPAARLATRPPIAALRERPLLQRWVARVTDLALYATGDPKFRCGRVSAVTAGPGRGRAAIETARGLLLHEVALDRERIASYVIVAPTEWNFHPRGPLRHWLQGAAAESRMAARELAVRAAAALDPCADCRIEID